MKLSQLITKMRTDRPDEWSMDDLARKAIELEKQRDELLTALESLCNTGYSPPSNKVWANAREVLNNVKGDVYAIAIRQLIKE